jgi:hypothetical protein
VERTRSGRARNIQSKAGQSADHRFTAQYNTPATAGKRDHHCGSVAATAAVVLIGTENRKRVIYGV